ncbi:GntR family transcriptional regulator [Gracilibacillus alcaliphilus]|uniref:GntR family transcriptional regulator n=1 Tax=Gracilibacillus alcaliphilus TaxID=1401441 RepID=UPI00195B9641|nr:GntR family transcriptional regulator [Gracilibacillus alcaliphilus]MBM7677513.1 DNA-binding GntR family transcriptional regulator [Gracilibacillus alcaliphilus]
MTKFSIEKSKPYYDQVYYKIREMIIFMELKPGERVYEAKLARFFHTSRSPVREAVKALCKEGLLVIDDKSRIFVYNPTFDDIIQIYQCRTALESLAAKLTAHIATDSQISKIGEVIRQTEQLLTDEEENREQLIRLNTAFHQLIIKYSNNNLLNKQLESINSLSFFFRVLNFKGDHRGRELFMEHQQIYQYIKQRNGELAARAMMKHIENDLVHFCEMNSETYQTVFKEAKDREKRT